MLSNAAVPMPEVSDDDIDRICNLLGLDKKALCGHHRPADKRLDVLKSLDTIDVNACPGSGKTTLLVVKLAILACKWKASTRGICVLSHTNAARQQIERGLGDHIAGRHLLSYPHFVGTIHAFIDQYVALPWLRSTGFHIIGIDDELTCGKRWRELPHGTRGFLKNQHMDEKSIRVVDTGFHWRRNGPGRNPCSQTAETYTLVQKACQQVAEEGYLCYGDMLLWANEALDRHPSITEAIRRRFPLLFIDEAQDTNDELATLLGRIFMQGDSAVVRQRFGDQNQAIFDSANDKGGAIDPFPRPEVKVTLPHSYRFGGAIAQLAAPLEVKPCHLDGLGPFKPLASTTHEALHTVFLFEDGNIEKVLDQYADLLAHTFDAAELCKGSFCAVGQVHRSRDDSHMPRCVGNYWPTYNPQLSVKQAIPRTFIEYVSLGLARSCSSGDTYPGVEMIAQALIRLCNIARPQARFHATSSTHRYLVALLESHPTQLRNYRRVLHNLIVHPPTLTQELWDADIAPSYRSIAEAIVGSEFTNQHDVERFLGWNDSPLHPMTAGYSGIQDNCYRVNKHGKDLSIRVGSIHSVKGETHTAMLILETYWHKHCLAALQDWIAGNRTGSDGCGSQQLTRLKVHYVAMTRPTHLLCLAMKKSTFQRADGEMDDVLLNGLRKLGWRHQIV